MLGYFTVKLRDQQDVIDISVQIIVCLHLRMGFFTIQNLGSLWDDIAQEVDSVERRCC